jgi:hypothetical protein
VIGVAVVREHLARRQLETDEAAARAQLEALGWTIRPGSTSTVMVAERGDSRKFATSVAGLRNLVKSDRTDRTRTTENRRAA